MLLRAKKPAHVSLKAEPEGGHEPTYAERPFFQPAPKHAVPEQSISPEAAYRLIHDELELDGKPKLNLASFVTTWMDEHALRLMTENVNKNLADQSEYPQTTDIAQRCVSMIADLWNAPAQDDVIGTYAIGSSEACMLGGLAMKRYWQENGAGKTGKPNIVMGTDVQVVWEKFANYFEVEWRKIYIEPGQYVITPEAVKASVDENTIGVVCILGTTFTGAYEPVKGINDVLLEIKQEKGWDIPIHVDAASGGFVAPFDRPALEWDFRLPQVRSINASGHKYGLVYPGIGWVVWRDRTYLPDDLIYPVNYLGGAIETFNLNFSRPAAQVLAQYYQLLRLGREGYRQLVTAMHTAARRLQDGLLRMGCFEALSNVGEGLPVVVVQLEGKTAKEFTVFDISAGLQELGWIVPAYQMPEKAQSVSVLRMVVREGLSVDLVDLFLSDMQKVLDRLKKRGGNPEARPASQERTIGVC